MLTREKLLELLEQHGLSHRADEILSQCKPSIHLTLGYGVDEADIPIGVSKMGGSPDVPPDFVWPEWNGIPLTFIAQFRLSDVKPYDVEDLLPEQGMLYFFFEKWVYYHKIRELYKSPHGPYNILYHENETTPLAHVEHPVALSPYQVYTFDVRRVEPYIACPVEFEYELTLPSLETTKLRPENDENGKETWDWYFAVEENYANPKHRLLGNETDIQTNYRMRHDSHSVWKLGEFTDWTLLVQVDTDDSSNRKERKPGFSWADMGLIYVWINKNDLKAHNFDRVWLNLVC